MNTVSQELFDYAVDIRRQLHMYPEVGFELPRTAALVARELEAMGITPMDRYGTCSVVGQIGNDPQKPTVALRADMDALPVQEKVDVPYKSRIDGAMHACGHDSHTAIVLAAAKVLKAREGQLSCNVRLLFQPSEEGAVSGAKMMVEHGAMDGVDAVLCTHCEQTLPAGTLGLCAGDYMAACIPMTVTFHGVTSHATNPAAGVDAIAMAVEAYGKLQQLVRDEAGNRPYIWSVGRFSGGQVHNVIADECQLDISFRFYDEAFARSVMDKAQALCERIAAARGGSAEISWRISCGAVYNDPRLTEQLRRAVSDLPGVELAQVAPKMSSEDFSWYLTKAPGALFRYGTRNEATGCTAPAHRNDFCIDESGMKAAILAFVGFVANYKANAD